MNNNSKFNFYNFFVVLVMLIGTVFGFVSFFISNNGTTNMIEETKYSVVEIKATTSSIGESYGSAIFVGSDGTLITNAHVVTYTKQSERYEFDEISIRFSFEEDYREVTLIKYDSDLDLAVLKLNDKNCSFKAISFGDSNSISAGDKVYAIGNLNNVGISLTSGIVSNPKINVEYNEVTREVIQCDLTIADGNSGGALVDENGKLIGITTFRLKDSSNNVIYGISYCVPASIVMGYIK